MPASNKLIAALKRTGSLILPGNEAHAALIEQEMEALKVTEVDGVACHHKGETPRTENTRIRVYPTGHAAFYTASGRRFLFVDPSGEPLNEAEWSDEPDGGQKLKRVRMQLDCGQWLGIVPGAKTFQSEIDIKGQPGWETMDLDGLRKKAAEAWRVPFSEVKYFYRDENLVPLGDGKYNVWLKKDGLYALDDGRFDKTIFISFMFSVNWERLDLIPVVELFQSTLPGSGGATFEFIWGLFDDQSREETLPPLCYRGLPTYPSNEAFNIFSSFFEGKGPEGENIKRVFMNPDRSHEITWSPRPTPPWRYFSREHQIVLTTQEGFLFKVTVKDDPVGIPFINCQRGARPSCEREIHVGPNSFMLVDGQDVREVPLISTWRVHPQTDPPPKRPPFPFGWKWFFNGFPPPVDPVKILYTVPFYPEGQAEIDEASMQPMVLDQIFYYMEMSPGMPAKLEKVGKVLVHTFDTVIAGCVDSSHEREVTVLFSDPEFAQKNACLLWNYGASKNELDNLKKVSFLLEKDHIGEVYQEKYDLIFKWIPFMYHQDREACEDMLRWTAEALNTDGMLFLVGPRPIQGLFNHYGLEMVYNDLVVNMPFFRQHLKMCPENLVNPDLAVFLVEKKPAAQPETPPSPPPLAQKEEPEPPAPLPLRSFKRPE